MLNKGCGQRTPPAGWLSFRERGRVGCGTAVLCGRGFGRETAVRFAVRFWETCVLSRRCQYVVRAERGFQAKVWRGGEGVGGLGRPFAPPTFGKISASS